MIADAPNLNALWAELIIEELIRNGVDCFVISPGSRSAPLTVAAARNPRAKTVVHYDERGAAFFALGVAKALGGPCALICTSGTAVANYFPAIVEASMSYVPLVVLTADRPPELQNAGANQTINQTHIYGPYVRHFAAMPCPDAQIPLEFVLTTVDHAVFAARRSPPGPVHVNCAFREPLATDGEPGKRCADSIRSWADSNSPYTTHADSMIDLDRGAVGALARTLKHDAKVLVVVGQNANMDSRLGSIAVPLTSFDGWVVFADVTSGARLDEAGPVKSVSIDNYELLLHSPKFRDYCQPDVVIHCGGPVLSKRLQEHLALVRPQYFMRVASHPDRNDPYHRVTHRFRCSPEEFLSAWASKSEGPPSDWTLRLAIASERAHDALRKVSNDQRKLSEPGLAILIGQLLRESPNDAVYVGNSMPVRDLDMYGGFLPSGTRVVANRGASGIDGNIATAAGYAKACDGHVVAVIGDLAALPDLNSLALLKQEGVQITLIVINNDGGGIFHFLPIAEHKDVFEKYFATPHGVHFEDAARMFGLPYARPATKDEFVESYRKARASGGSSIIEVVTDREENLKLHRRISDAVVKALEDL